MERNCWYTRGTYYDQKVLPCPNADCSESMQRAKHFENDCEYTVISYKYEGIGCDVKMKRKDMEQAR